MSYGFQRFVTLAMITASLYDVMPKNANYDYIVCRNESSEENLCIYIVYRATVQTRRHDSWWIHTRHYAARSMPRYAIQYTHNIQQNAYEKHRKNTHRYHKDCIECPDSDRKLNIPFDYLGIYIPRFTAIESISKPHHALQRHCTTEQRIKKSQSAAKRQPGQMRFRTI